MFGSIATPSGLVESPEIAYGRDCFDVTIVYELKDDASGGLVCR